MEINVKSKNGYSRCQSGHYHIMRGCIKKCKHTPKFVQYYNKNHVKDGVYGGLRYSINSWFAYRLCLR